MCDYAQDTRKTYYKDFPTCGPVSMEIFSKMQATCATLTHNNGTEFDKKCQIFFGQVRTDRFNKSVMNRCHCDSQVFNHCMENNTFAIAPIH